MLFNNFGFGCAGIYERIALQGFNYEVIQSATDIALGTYYLKISGFTNLTGALILAGRGLSRVGGLTLIGADADGTTLSPDVSTGVAIYAPELHSTLSTYPSPASSAVHIACHTQHLSSVSILIVDTTGLRVVTLHDGWHSCGEIDVVWDGRTRVGTPVPASPYFARCQTPNTTLQKHLVRIP